MARIVVVVTTLTQRAKSSLYIGNLITYSLDTGFSIHSQLQKRQLKSMQSDDAPTSGCFREKNAAVLVLAYVLIPVIL